MQKFDPSFGAHEGKPREIVFHTLPEMLLMSPEVMKLWKVSEKILLPEVLQKLFTVLVVIEVGHVILCSCTFCSSKWWHPAKKRICFVELLLMIVKLALVG